MNAPVFRSRLAVRWNLVRDGAPAPTLYTRIRNQYIHCICLYLGGEKRERKAPTVRAHTPFPVTGFCVLLHSLSTAPCTSIHQSKQGVTLFCAGCRDAVEVRP